MRLITVIRRAGLVFLFCLLVNFGRAQEETEEAPDENEKIATRQAYFDLFAPPLVFRRPPVQHGFVPTAVRFSDPRKERLEPYMERLKEVVEKCPKKALYASFNFEHRSSVTQLAEIFDEIHRTVGNDTYLMLLYSDIQHETHPLVWYTAFFRAHLNHKPEIFLTLDKYRPNPIYTYPSRFFPAEVWQQNFTTQKENVVHLDERFGEDNGVENLLWYFREDVQMSSNHWIWHLLNPNRVAEQGIDRRGELFFFFHHEIIARYAAERLSNGLEDIEPLQLELNTVIEEGYNSHLTDRISSLNWGNRQPFQKFSDHLGDREFRQLYNQTVLRNRVVHGLGLGTLYHENGTIEIGQFDNITVLADLIEAANTSLSPRYYNLPGLHNWGHVLLGYLSRFNTSDFVTMGVMGDNTVTMRDTLFYRWHKYINVLFLTYKATHLVPYTPQGGEHPLIFEGIRVTDAKVIADPENDYVDAEAPNILRTFWNTTRFDLPRGFDFRADLPSVDLNICTKHLDHEEFSYRIQIESSRQIRTPITLRIFLAPRYKSLNGRRRYTMAEQRTLFFLLDTFKTHVNPGTNVIRHHSVESTVTAPWPRSFTDIAEDIFLSNTTTRTDCDCGWPHHLLLPKGAKTGMVYDMLVMVTDAEEDKVIQPPTYPNSNNPANECVPSYVHCGLAGRKYPDSKPMGYPLDRRPYSVPKIVQTPSTLYALHDVEVATLEEYVSHVPNMATSQITIKHENVNVGDGKYDCKFN